MLPAERARWIERLLAAGPRAAKSLIEPSKIPELQQGEIRRGDCMLECYQHTALRHAASEEAAHKSLIIVPNTAPRRAELQMRSSSPDKREKFLER
jgi:hypothetical protein